MQSPTNRTSRVRPRPALKRFGQHFLEPAWVEKLARAVAPTATDDFFEIGPGRGALTRPLAAAARSVVAFEIDRHLADDLRSAGIPNLHVIEGDFLHAPIPAVSGSVRVVGNLPYNVASPILFRLADLYAGGLPITDAIIMLQREVADRLLASPGGKEYGALTVLIGYRAQVDRLLSLPPGAFRPAPKVHSTVVRLRFRPPSSAIRDEHGFRRLVQLVFTRRRKTLANALLALPQTDAQGVAAALQRAAIDGRRRPETLSIAEFVTLSEMFDPPT